MIKVDFIAPIALRGEGFQVKNQEVSINFLKIPKSFKDNQEVQEKKIKNFLNKFS